MDVHGRSLGRISEFAVSPMEDPGHVGGLLVRLTGARRSMRPSLVPISAIQLTQPGAIQVTEEMSSFRAFRDDEFLLLERDLLDRQIIDVHGHKVVRVNDVDLVWEPDREVTGRLRLRIAEVEVGMRGAIRRILKGLPVNTVEGFACRVRSAVIPWEFVDLIDRDPGRRVKLKIEQERLSRMHPADIAEILEDLAPAERQALFRSLDEEVAAEALEEVDPKMQRQLIEGLDCESVAGIVEEMDPGAAADLLSELTDERSDAILEEMDPEERHEVEELLEFASDSAAGQMTTEYLELGAGARVADAVAALREYEGDAENLTDIYLVDDEERLQGIVPLVKLVLAESSIELGALVTGHLVSCHVDERFKKVAELFDKYNLRSLPVLDKDKKIVGVILAERVIAQLQER